MPDSPYRNKTWEFWMTPIIGLTALLVQLIASLSPVGYMVAFEIRALSDEELDEWELDDEE